MKLQPLQKLPSNNFLYIFYGCVPSDFCLSLTALGHRKKGVGVACLLLLLVVVVIAVTAQFS